MERRGSYRMCNDFMAFSKEFDSDGKAFSFPKNPIEMEVKEMKTIVKQWCRRQESRNQLLYNASLLALAAIKITLYLFAATCFSFGFIILLLGVF